MKQTLKEKLEYALKKAGKDYQQAQKDADSENIAFCEGLEVGLHVALDIVNQHNKRP